MSISEKPKKKKKLRHNEYYDMTVTFDKLYADSQNGKIFNKLMDIIVCDENIKLAYRNIKKNSGSQTAGVDQLTIEDLKGIETEKFIENVRKRLSFYKPKPVRRVEIPKENGKTRPLGIPTIWDRIIQQCILQVLEPICEAQFHERSNGFRPNRSTENAIAQCYRMIQKQGLHYVVDVDICGFFDNVDHHKLKRQIWNMGIQDKKLICIISQMLKAPIIMPNQERIYPSKGTPQGGILSPLLSNIVLNELDWWVTSQWEIPKTRHNYQLSTNKNGSLSRTSTYKALRQTNLKEMYIVRYADDFKIFCRTYKSACNTFHAVKLWLEDRLKLQISPEKSKVINLRTHYSEFLGFKIKAIKKSKKFVVKSHMKEKAIQKEISKLKDIVNEFNRQKDTKDTHKISLKFNSTVWGIHNYYQIATNINLDCKRIAFQVGWKLKLALSNRLTNVGHISSRYLNEKYGMSKQVRFVDGIALTPIGYIKTKNPMYKKRTVNKYTPEGRQEIHKTLGLDMTILHTLMRNPVDNRSIEYSDNRISLYCAQYGKCGVTGKILEYSEIHCHHKIAVIDGGTDEYSNLIILNINAHRLVHATAKDTINQYLNIVKPDEISLKKINNLRTKLNLETITL